MASFYDFVRPVVFAMDAERAHWLAIKALKSGLLPEPAAINDPKIRVNACGLSCPNPVGLAPGFDKNAEVPDEMLAQGFGYVEIGTVTPLAQAGNPKPRLFRLAEDKAVINRMGFNNDGHVTVLARLLDRYEKGIVGVNIGANKTSKDRVQDYVHGIEVFHDVADYLTINISSPNTPGLRGLQSASELSGLLERLNKARAQFARKVPMLLKIAPDLGNDELEEICDICAGGSVDGLIVSNTTLSRLGLQSPARNEAGGLSGEPLFESSTRMLARAYRLTGGKLPLVGVGGISSGQQAFDKIRAGATLVQLYSALVYHGVDLAHKIVTDLVKLIDKHNFNSIESAIGTDVDRWL